MWERLKDVVSNRSSTQAVLEDFLSDILSRDQLGERGQRVIDLGCGDGRSFDLFRRLLPTARWTGVDIESSPEVSLRTRTDAEFCTYDGLSLPFPDGSVDLVFSCQVLEHVRHPEKVLAEVTRVLRPGGRFVGSTSHLEPYHSFSYWSFTPWGFRVIAQDAGLRLLNVQPGIDSLTLIWRAVLGRPKLLGRYFRSESPLNWLIRLVARIKGQSTARTNIQKLQFCGQFAFDCVKD